MPAGKYHRSAQLIGRMFLLLAVPGLLRLDGAQRAFDVPALLNLARISDPQLSPDGKSVAFMVQVPDLDANTRPTNIYVVPAAGGAARRLTTEGAHNERARWSPDSRRLAFV